MTTERRTMNLDELAQALGLGRTLIRGLARKDELPHPIKVIRVGRRMLVSREAVERLLTTERGEF